MFGKVYFNLLDKDNSFEEDMMMSYCEEDLVCEC